MKRHPNQFGSLVIRNLISLFINYENVEAAIGSGNQVAVAQNYKTLNPS